LLVRTVLLGDSHLARIKRELPRLGESVLNAAVGGATVLDLEHQGDGALLTADDVVVVSVGTNDGAPWNKVPVSDFHRTLTDFVVTRRVRTWVVMALPGVDESRLGTGERTNAVLDAYWGATAAVAESASARLIDSRALLRPLGSRAFDRDGVHLSGEGYRLLLPALAKAVSL
jgi:lysophospholipase L1-like esterase